MSYHFAKFGGHRYCGSADVSFFHFSRDYVVKRSRDFDVGVPPPQATTLLSLVVIGIPKVQV